MAYSYHGPTKTCLRPELPIRFHGIYEQYDAIVPHFQPKDAPEIEFAVTADEDSEMMASKIVNYVRCGFVGGNSELCKEFSNVIRSGGGTVEHWKLWQVFLTGQTLVLSFVHRESGESQQVQLSLSTLTNIRLTFWIFSESGQACHKFYLDYQLCHWQAGVLKAAEWRCDTSSIAMMTWYLGVGSVLMRQIFQTDPNPVKALLEPFTSAES